MQQPGINKTKRFGSKGQRRVRLSARSQSMLTVRDIEIVKWVYSVRLATREQVQRLFFTAGGRTRCQDRLAALFRYRYLDRLPNRAVNAPEVYLASRRAVRGLRLLRTLFPNQQIAPLRIASARVAHVLAIGDVRSAFTEACPRNDIQLLFWINEEQLRKRTEPSGIIPDAYFQVLRYTSDGQKRSAFFVEVERSTKSKHALQERFRRYADFYYGGEYERRFGTQALRVLFLMSADYGVDPTRHTGLCAQICERLGVTFFRFAALDKVVQISGDQLLSSAIWQQPGVPEPCSLF